MKRTVFWVAAPSASVHFFFSPEDGSGIFNINVRPFPKYVVLQPRRLYFVVGQYRMQLNVHTIIVPSYLGYVAG
jgi:hypothetical protein